MLHNSKIHLIILTQNRGILFFLAGWRLYWTNVYATQLFVIVRLSRHGVKQGEERQEEGEVSWPSLQDTPTSLMGSCHGDRQSWRAHVHALQSTATWYCTHAHTHTHARTYTRTHTKRVGILSLAPVSCQFISLSIDSVNGFQKRKKKKINVAFFFFFPQPSREI